MNAIRKINDINLAELECGTSDEASWHYDYRDSPYIFIGGLPFDIAEPDLLTIFSQYGIITHLKLVKDHKTGQSKGFAYLRYHNYQSCVLAIDNFNGIKIYDRFIKVDHVYYTLRDKETEADFAVDYSMAKRAEIEQGDLSTAPTPKLLGTKTDSKDGPGTSVPRDDDFTDPMKAFDEFADPMLAFDEFVHPMLSLNKGSSDKSRKRHRKHGESSRKHQRNDVQREETHSNEESKRGNEGNKAVDDLKPSSDG